MINRLETAILLFMRDPAEDARAKSLLDSRSSNFRLFQQLASNVERTLHHTGLPFFIATEQDQRARSFGDRITSAIGSVFAKGYQRVIVVGNDCPDLSVKDIVIASEQLKERGIVLGPDLRGGAFLIGLSRDHYSPEHLKKLRWQSEGLLDSFTSYAMEQGTTPFLLRPKFDINQASDLRNARSYTGALHLILQRVFHTIQSRWSKSKVPAKGASIDSALQRGPPLVIGPS